MPLVSPLGRNTHDGWCPYNYTLEDSPDVEIMCGGLNEKTPDAAAIWRQGNLLAFGFDLSPEEMNDTAKALLLSAIVYISKFTQDRPILQVPTSGTRMSLSRDMVGRWLNNEDNELKVFENCMAPEALAAAPGKDRETYKRWFESIRSYLHTDASLRLVIDEEARSSGIGFAQADFPEKALAALRAGGPHANTARELLARYVPEGPGKDATFDAWDKWFQQNRPYVFFSDFGGYRWYVDPLAKSRQVATAKLRGAARADVRGSTVK